MVARFLSLAFAVFLATVPAPIRAQEYISVPGLLSDEAFYRLVSCAAPPDGECGKPEIRWPESTRVSLSVGVTQIDPAFPDYKFNLVDQAIDDAIEEINSAGARLFIERVYEGTPDISFYLLATPQGARIEGTGNPRMDGYELAIGRVAIRSLGEDIQEAAIALSLDIQRREVASVVLEELVQALGLPTDIRSPAYLHSVFAEDGNAAVRLEGQDAEALRRHYPHF